MTLKRQESWHEKDRKTGKANKGEDADQTERWKTDSKPAGALQMQVALLLSLTDYIQLRGINSVDFSILYILQRGDTKNTTVVMSVKGKVGTELTGHTSKGSTAHSAISIYPAAPWLARGSMWEHGWQRKGFLTPRWPNRLLHKLTLLASLCLSWWHWIHRC